MRIWHVVELSSNGLWIHFNLKFSGIQMLNGIAEPFKCIFHRNIHHTFQVMGASNYFEISIWISIYLKYHISSTLGQTFICLSLKYKSLISTESLF